MAGCGDGAGGGYTPTAGLYRITGQTIVAADRVDTVPANNVTAAVAHVNANPGEYTLLVGADTDLPGHATGGFNVSGVNLTIIGIGDERRISLSSNGRMFTVGAAGQTGISLTIGNNITLVGRNAAAAGANNDQTLVLVQNGASLTMNAGAQITGNTATGNNQAGGVHVTGANSIFTMNGGVIYRNNVTGTLSGGGVRVTGGASFYMSGDAVIQTNTVTGAGSAGAVFVTGINSTFTMLGGEIRGNGADGGNTVGGVGAADGALRMVTGVIYGAGSANPNTSVPGPVSSFAVLRLVGNPTPGIAERGTLDGSGNWDPASAVSLLPPGAGARGYNETKRVVNGQLQP